MGDDLGASLPRLRGAVPGPASLALARRLRAVESRNVTWLADDFPVFWEAARGCNVRDADGNVFLDVTGAFGVAFAGHAHPRIVEAVRAQAGRLVHGMGDIHPPETKVRLLEALVAFGPWDDARVVLGTSGSEAVEIALKTALLATGRAGVVAFRGGYHGLMGGALATTERDDFRAPFRARLFDGVAHTPFATRAGEVDAALAAMDRLLAEGVGGHAVGCVLVEPIQGRAGVRIPAPGFLDGVARRARDAGALVAFDEVFTGCGRTGHRFGLEATGVVPDLLCVGKALGGGLPLSACMGPPEVMDAWPPSGGEALHTSTFLGHPLASAAALAFLDVVREEGLIERARTVGATLRDGLAGELGGVAGVREVRGPGLFLGVVLERPGAGVDVATAALGDGLLLLPAGAEGEVVELTPPAVLTEAQAAWAVETVVRRVREAV